MKDPYRTPSAGLGECSEAPLSAVVSILAGLSVIFSFWYLAMDGRNWFSPLAGMAGWEVVREWLTRALYGLPKIGLAVGFVALFKFRQHAFRIYLLCWLSAIGHTAMFYGAYPSVSMTEIEFMRLSVHHLIPHAFYFFMLSRLKRLGG